MKPILFIDVDGVLFGFYDGYFQLRPNVIGFLDWCQKHFECYWLTCWGNGFEKIAAQIYGAKAVKEIKNVNWHTYNHNKANAAVHVGKGRQFYWIEDGLPDDEIEVLYHVGLLGNYIYVNPFGKDELYKVKERLERSLL